MSDKSSLRNNFLEKRQAVPEAQQLESAQIIKDLFLKEMTLSGDEVIAGYWPIRGEIDPRPLMEHLIEQGHQCALPVVQKEGLEFHGWETDATMKVGPYDIPVPEEEGPLKPDIILVPLLAYDQAGHRLGYGGGFYDGALAECPEAKTVGLAYSFQEVEKLPIEEHDVRLDHILTEKEWLTLDKG